MLSRALLLCFEADLTFLRKEQKVLLTMWQGWVGAGGRDSDKMLNMKGSDEVFQQIRYKSRSFFLLYTLFKS